MKSNKVLSQLGMPAPKRPMHDAFNQELLREKLYNLDAVRELLPINVPLLNPQQEYVFDTLMKIVNDGTEGFTFDMFRVVREKFF